MATQETELSMTEALYRWTSAEIQTATFRALTAVQILNLSVPDLPTELLDHIRRPLADLYELSRDSEDTMRDDDGEEGGPDA